MRRAALLLVALAACGPTTGGGPPILRPAAFALDVRGIRVVLDESGAVHAEGCEARLDFASARLDVAGRTVARLEGDVWPRALVLGAGSPPVAVDETHVEAGGRALFSLDGGRLVDGGGGVTPAPALVAEDLSPDETTTALALLALVGGCWEDGVSDR